MNLILSAHTSSLGNALLQGSKSIIRVREIHCISMTNSIYLDVNKK